MLDKLGSRKAEKEEEEGGGGGEREEGAEEEKTASHTSRATWLLRHVFTSRLSLDPTECRTLKYSSPRIVFPVELFPLPVLPTSMSLISFVAWSLLGLKTTTKNNIL